MFSPKAKYVQGNVLSIDYTPVAAVAAGDVIVINNIPCVAHRDIAANVQGAIATPAGGAVYDLVKDASVFADHAIVYWDPIGLTCTSTSAGNKVFGVAVGAALTGDATARVQHLPVTSATTVTGGIQGTIADPGNAGAIPVVGSGNVQIVTAGAETRTIAAATSVGIRLLLDFKTKVGNCVITVASTINTTGNNTITMSANGQSIELVSVNSNGTFRWAVSYNDGTALSTV